MKTGHGNETTIEIDRQGEKEYRRVWHHNEYDVGTLALLVLLAIIVVELAHATIVLPAPLIWAVIILMAVLMLEHFAVFAATLTTFNFVKKDLYGLLHPFYCAVCKGEDALVKAFPTAERLAEHILSEHNKSEMQHINFNEPERKKD